MIRSIKELGRDQLSEKVVFLRVDFNVPLHKGKILNDQRIRKAIPTIQYLKDKGAKVLICTHLGRPTGVDESLRVDLIKDRLAELLGENVLKSNESIGPAVKAMIQNMKWGEVLLLENCRFHQEDVKNGEALSKAFADLADIFVLDAFGVAHRKQSSTYGVATHLPAYAGFLVEDEVSKISNLLFEPKRPYLAIIGGAKVSTKIGILEKLLERVDYLFVAGGMAFTFLKLQGYEVGKSLVDEESMELAAAFLEKAAHCNAKVFFPADVLVAAKCAPGQQIDEVTVDQIPADKMGLDIGQKTIHSIKKLVNMSQTIFWNGPLGVIEIPEFSVGTFAVANQIANSAAISVVGGGESVAAIHQAGIADRITHISTGGGASLEFIQNRSLPAIDLLKTDNGAPVHV